MKDPNKLFKDAFDAQNKGENKKAKKLYELILTFGPENNAKKIIANNLGLVLMSMNKYEEAIKYFNISNDISDDKSSEWNKCLCYLNINKWDKAVDLFPSRYNNKNSTTAVTFPDLPITQITKAIDAKDKRLLVLNEQGLGDELLFTTQLSKLDRIVKHATVQVSKSTIGLLRKLYKFDNIELVEFESISIEDVDNHDMFIGLGDVFMSLYNEGDSVINHKETHIFKETSKIGVCWSSNMLSPNTAKRGVDPNIFKKIKYDLVSLQYGKGYGEMIGLEDYLPSDLLETWNKMDELDLVITVDTSVAHLSGLKQIPTILLINKHLDWRWKFRDSEDDRYSMFYPMLEIVSVNDDLNSIIENIIN